DPTEVAEVRVCPIPQRYRPRDVRPDVVPLHDVAVAADLDARAGVRRDDVARGRARAADRVPGASEDDALSGPRVEGEVTQGLGPGDVRADEVPLNEVAGGGARVGIRERYPIASVAGDDVAGTGNEPADRVVRRFADEDAATQAEAVVHVRDRRGARRVGPDEIALDEVAGGSREPDCDAPVEVPGDDVPRRGARATNQVAGRVQDEDAPATEAAHWPERSSRVRSKVVARDDVPGARETFDRELGT